MPVPIRNLKLLQPPAFLRSLAAARSSALSQLSATPCFRGCLLPRGPTNARSPPGGLLHRTLRPLPLRRFLAESPPYRRLLAEPLPSSPRSVSDKLHLFARYA